MRYTFFIPQIFHYKIIALSMRFSVFLKFRQEQSVRFVLFAHIAYTPLRVSNQIFSHENEIDISNSVFTGVVQFNFR